MNWIALALQLIDKLIPDPAAKAAAQLEALKMQQAGAFKELDAQLAMITAQTDINKVEAASGSLFVSGWRPAFGWVFAAIFAANYIGVPMLAWGCALAGWPAPQRLNIEEVWPVLSGLLGLGAARTLEKIKGAA